MIYRQSDGIEWLEFELLAECPIIHGCTLKHGGVSQGGYASLNLARTSQDHPSHIQENRSRVSKAMGVPSLVFGKLIHGDGVCKIDSADIDPPISDGLSTSVPNLAIAMTQADCQAAIFYDPVNHAVSNVHAGWRGSVQNIYGKIVEHMKSVYGSRAADLLVCISPSLGPESSEFVNYKTELPESFWDYQFKPNYFDFWAISEKQLMDAGVLKGHIQIAAVDTYANSQDYFSYRRDRVSGRQATVCCLKNKV